MREDQEIPYPDYDASDAYIQQVLAEGWTEPSDDEINAMLAAAYEDERMRLIEEWATGELKGGLL